MPEAGSGRSGWAAPLCAVLSTAALLRFYHLSFLPPANYRDVALTASDALRAAAGHPCLHYTYDEGLYANLMGVLFLVLGASDWTVRAPGSLFGVLTCWGVYRLGKALNLEREGLYGAALLAASFWHLVLSRSGFRVILLPLLLSFSFAFLVEGVRKHLPGRLAVAGLLLGLGVHVYPSVRFAPFIVPPYLLAELGLQKERWRALCRGLGLYAGAALLAALPMLLNYLHHPEHFTLPRRLVSVFSPMFDRRFLIPELEHNLLATLLMFHVHGDDNWRHNLPGAPMLDPFTGLLFVLGIILVCRRGENRALRALLLAWLGAMLLPNLLSVEGVPHGLRSCGVLPAVALLAGIGLGDLERRLAERAGRRLAMATAVMACALLCVWSAHRYFDTWGRDPELLGAHDGAYRAAARVLLEAPAGVTPFLVTNGRGLRSHGQPAEVWCYLFEMRDHLPVLVGPGDSDKLILKGRPALIAFVRRDPLVLQAIRALNPEAPVRAVEAPDLSSDSPVYAFN